MKVYTFIEYEHDTNIIAKHFMSESEALVMCYYMFVFSMNEKLKRVQAFIREQERRPDEWFFTMCGARYNPRYDYNDHYQIFTDPAEVERFITACIAAIGCMDIDVIETDDSYLELLVYDERQHTWIEKHA